MGAIEVHSGFTFHAAQQAMWDAFVDPGVRFVVASCGRRMGKTEAAKIMLAYYATQGKRAAYMAPTNKMMDQMWEEVKDFLRAAIRAKDEQLHRLDLYGGGVIEFWSLDNPDGPRGRSYDLAILDECAMLPSARIFEAVIRPTLADRRGKAVFLSTPRGLNWFHTYYLRGIAANREHYPKWRSFQFPTAANPYIDPEEIEDARRDNPTRVFREEFLAVFESGEDAVFRITDQTLTAQWQDKGYPAHVYMAGVDLARSQDFSVISIIDVSIMEQCYIDRSQGVEFELQIGRLQALHAKFQFQTILVEDNAAGAPVIEQMQNRGLPVVPFRTTNMSKLQAVNALAMRFERDELRILNHDAQVGELRAYQATRLPSGAIRYEGPKDGHDDTVMALMLANWACEGWTMGEASFVNWAA